MKRSSAHVRLPSGSWSHRTDSRQKSIQPPRPVSRLQVYDGEEARASHGEGVAFPGLGSWVLESGAIRPRRGLRSFSRSPVRLLLRQLCSLPMGNLVLAATFSCEQG